MHQGLYRKHLGVQWHLMESQGLAHPTAHKLLASPLKFSCQTLPQKHQSLSWKTWQCCPSPRRPGTNKLTPKQKEGHPLLSCPTQDAETQINPQAEEPEPPVGFQAEVQACSPTAEGEQWRAAMPPACQQQVLVGHETRPPRTAGCPLQCSVPVGGEECSPWTCCRREAREATHSTGQHGCCPSCALPG